MTDSDWKIAPMLAQSGTTDAMARSMLADDRWRAERKVDGVRLLIHCHDGKVIGVNRKGNVTLMPPKVADAFVWMEGEWVWDGELVKDTYHIFDIPRALQVIGLRTPYDNRRELLEGLWPSLDMPDCVRLLRSATGAADKQALVDDVREHRGEGVIFKRGTAAYLPGPTRSADCLKWKFVKDVDCVVMELGLEGKQNFSVGLWNEANGELVEIATVSALTGDGPKVQVLDVVSVQCLYVSEDNRLVQPTLPRLRTGEKERHECVLSQLDELKTNKEIT